MAYDTPTRGVPHSAAAATWAHACGNPSTVRISARRRAKIWTDH